MQIAWKKYRVDEYRFALPDTWKADKAKRRKVGDVWGKEIRFFDKGKMHIATLRCPIVMTGYEGWDIEEQKRTHKAGKQLHGATLWFGKAKDPELKDFALLFMHRNTFDHWMDTARDERHSCQLTAGAVDLTHDRVTWQRIYESVR